MTGEPAQYIIGKTIQEQMMQILKMLRDQADAIQEQIDDLQRQIDDIGPQTIAPIVDGTTPAMRAIQDESGNNIEQTYATKTELTTGLGNKLDTTTAASTYLTITSASSTYLSKTDAASTYATLTALAGKADTATTLGGYGITDGVTLDTQQDITGEKRIRRTGSMMDFINNNSEYNVVPASALRSALYYLDKNAQLEGAMEWEKHTDGSHSWAINLRNKNGTWLSRTFKIFKMDDGTEYVVLPYRTYNSANVNDAVTIGSLAANPSVIHATGNEFKSGDLSLGSGASYMNLQGGVSNQIARILKHNGVTDNVAFLDVRILNDNTAQLVLCKNINGTETSTVVATL